MERDRERAELEVDRFPKHRNCELRFLQRKRFTYFSKKKPMNRNCDSSGIGNDPSLRGGGCEDGGGVGDEVEIVIAIILSEEELLLL